MYMSKHMKRCSISFVIREIRKFKLSLPTNIMSAMENRGSKERFRGCRTVRMLHTADGDGKWYRPFEHHLAFC